MNLKKIIGIGFFLLTNMAGFSQNDKAILIFDLQKCLDYAKQHYPAFQQSQIDKQIVDQEVNENMSAWFPQVGFNTQFQHSQKAQQGSLSVGDQTYLIELSKKNTNPFNFTINQVLVDRDAIYSAKTTSPLRKQADMNAEYQWIDLQVNVTKVFYNVLLQQQQLQIYESDIERLKEAFKDAQSQYEGGIVDRTDVQRSKIALNNGMALYQNAVQMVNISYANLKQVIGYNDSTCFIVQADIQSLIPGMYMDTTLIPDVKNRVEYVLLDTERKLLSIDLKYSHWGYIPDISLFGNYPITFANNDIHLLYQNNPFINPNIGITFSLSLFEGLLRIRQTKKAKLSLERNHWDFEALQNNVNKEYVGAISIYKSNLNNYAFLKENMEDAEKVYDIIFLQYKEGVKTYLDLTSAHSDLLTAQLSYYNAVFQVMASKIDVEKALGLIKCKNEE